MEEIIVPPEHSTLGTFIVKIDNALWVKSSCCRSYLFYSIEISGYYYQCNVCMKSTRFLRSSGYTRLLPDGPINKETIIFWSGIKDWIAIATGIPRADVDLEVEGESVV